jgi:hypothetical protein
LGNTLEGVTAIESTQTGPNNRDRVPLSEQLKLMAYFVKEILVGYRRKGEFDSGNLGGLIVVE